MIDIIIPCCEKDIACLDMCITGIKHNLIDSYENIYIVAPHNDNLIKYCEDNSLIFVDERTIISDEIFEKLKNNIKQDNWKWLLQQFIKLTGIIGNNDDFLIIDADHILVNEYSFLDNDKYTFYLCDEYHVEYFEMINKLFGNLPKQFIESFISEKMIFNKKFLSEMKNEIEMYTHKPWYDAIIDNYPKYQHNCFSEFETYGTWMLYRHLDKMTLIKDSKKYIKQMECNKYNSYENIKEYSNIDKFNCATILKHNILTW